MLIVESYPLAVAMCVITMLYWDYSLGVLLLTLVFAFTIGSMGEEGRGFIADITQASPEAIRSALIGGALFNFANILLVVAIEIAGMAVAFPVAIGLALVIGVVANYIATPVGDAVWDW